MNTDQLDVEIADIQGDISSITGELDILKSQKKALSEEYERLKKELDVSIPVHENGVEIITHDPFDGQISEYFKSRKSNDGSKIKDIPDQNQALESMGDEQAKLLELKENILYESIFRIGGITAFPINKYTLNEQETLGIRFDNFSNINKSFVVPNYVILRRSESKDGLLQWEVYRHTLPQYVPVKEYASSDFPDLLKFVTDVRNHLALIQYKHDKIEQLRKFTSSQFKPLADESPIVTGISRDLQCQRVTVTIAGTIEMELICSLDHIEIVNFTKEGKDEETLLHCSNILRNTTFQHLHTHFSKILQILFNVNII